MKKHILLFAGLVALFSACKKIEDAPVDTSDAKLSAALEKYQTQLAGAQFGWKGYLLTDADVAVSFTFTFNNANRTVMTAEFAPTAAESSYRLKALQRPTLIFDTYSTLHLLSDPNPNKLGGATGAGYYSDFEFAFVSSSPDTIKMEGTFNKSKLILVRATSAADVASTYTAANTMATTLSKLRTYFKRATVGGKDCEVRIDASNRVIGFNYLEGTELKKASSYYFVSGTKLILFTPIVVGNVTITEISGVTFNTSTGFISGTASGSAIDIREAITPLQYDKTTAARFLANPVYGTYSESYDGFTVDGVVDAYGVNSIPNFYSIDYYPKNTATSSGALRFYLTTAYSGYYPAFTNTVDNNGILINTLLGVVNGTATNAVKTIINNTALAMTKAGGFYVIQTDTKKYDLVAVADARSWITFQ